MTERPLTSRPYLSLRPYAAARPGLDACLGKMLCAPLLAGRRCL
ncbi:hypothetical protein ACFXJO_03635 [Streptomyces lavendulae]